MRHVWWWNGDLAGQSPARLESLWPSRLPPWRLGRSHVRAFSRPASAQSRTVKVRDANAFTGFPLSHAAARAGYRVRNGPITIKRPVGGLQMNDDRLSDHRDRLEQALAVARFGTRLSGLGLNPGTASPAQRNRSRKGTVMPRWPGVGRVYGGWFGEHGTFPADRDAAGEIRARLPWMPRAAASNRAFLGRAVTYAAAEGYDQFVDIGAGPPIHPMVHEIARNVQGPDAEPARVVYADSDRLITTQTLTEVVNTPGVLAVTGDLRDPGSVFERPEFPAVIDLAEPVCLIMTAVLHFLSPAEAERAVKEVTGLVAPGSLIVMSCGIVSPGDIIKYNAAVGGPESPVKAYPYSCGDFVPLFRDLHVMEPGIVWAREWRPARGTRDTGMLIMMGGVGRKP